MAEKVPLYIDFASGEIKEFAPSDKVKKTNLDSGGSGDLVGPEAATDNAIAVFSGASGKLLKDSAVLLSSKANTEHTHAIGDVTGLQTALDGKQASGNYAPATNGTSVLKGDGLGGFSSAVSGTDFARPLVSVTTLANDATTGANVTPIVLTGLIFTYEANSKYRIWFMGRVSPAAATTGCGFQFDLSSVVTAIDLQFFHQLANTGTQTGGHSIADNASVGVSSGMPGTSTYPVTGFGLLVTGANTGTAQLMFRSETTAAITAKAGIVLVIEKIK